MTANIIKAYFAYRFLKLLVTPWEKTPAYEAGVVDGQGRLLIKPRLMSQKQRSVYGVFDRLSYNLKRMMKTIPGGSSKIGSYAAALAMIREHASQQVADEIEKALDEDTPVTVAANADGFPSNPGKVARRKKPNEDPVNARHT